MSCENLTNVRKTCANPIAGLRNIYIRDWESFGPISIINGYDEPAYDNLYAEGTYNNVTVVNGSSDEPTTMLADIVVGSGGTITSITLKNTENYYYATVGQGYYFPSLPIDEDNDSQYTIVVSSLKNTDLKHTMQGPNSIYYIDRTTNDFGETVSDSWYEIQFAKESGSFVTNTVEDLATGNIRYEFTVECVLPNYQLVDNLNTLIVGQRPLVMFVVDWMNSDYVWFLGLDLPMVCTKVEKMTGAKYGDGNMTKLTFTGYDTHPEIFTGI
jgi:hypothetical protein